MPRLAVLIDAENVDMHHAAAIAKIARDLGDLNIVRLYGDFTELRLSGWLDVSRANGYQTILQLSGGRGKNSTDIMLTIDTMDILASGAVDAFCLVSDDRDFLPLAARLRAAGKRVYAIGRREDERMRRICSQMFTLAPPPLKVRPVEDQPLKDLAPKDEPPIIKAYRDIVTKGADEMSLSQVSLALRQHAPGLIPATGKGVVRKMLRATGRFEESGSGSALKVRLKGG